MQRTQKVNIVGYQDRFFGESDEQEALNKIVELKPEIVTDAMGSPRQEKFSAMYRKPHPTVFL